MIENGVCSIKHLAMALNGILCRPGEDKIFKDKRRLDKTVKKMSLEGDMVFQKQTK